MLLATEYEVRCAVREEGFPVIKSRCPADGTTVREQTKEFVRERCRTDRAFRQKTRTPCRKAASTAGVPSIPGAPPSYPRKGRDFPCRINL